MTVSQTSTPVSIPCGVPDEAGVLLHVVNYTSGPIVDANISSYSVFYCNNGRQIVVNPISVANSSGWADPNFGSVGNYYVSIAFGSPESHAASSDQYCDISTLLEKMTVQFSYFA